MVEVHGSSSRVFGRRCSWGRIRRVVGALVVATVVVLVVAGLAPFALRERVTSGAVANTASALSGPVKSATEGLRGLGYSCSDRANSPATVIRLCSRVQMMSRSRVHMVADGTGAIQFVRISIDQGLSSAAGHQDVLEVVTKAVGLLPEDRSKVLAAATGAQQQSFTSGWGSVVVRPGVPDSTLRAAGSTGVGLTPSTATLRVSVDALAAAAAANGYTCMTPQVNTIRSCQRSDGGYSYSLWLQGTNSYVTSLNLDVGSTFRTQTRSHWVQAMTQALSWVDSDQGRRLSTWLARSADAPGADGYVDGLSVSFLVRADEYGKETFGGIAAECARSMDDISGCGP